MSIPSRLNLCLVLAVMAAGLGLLWLASRLEDWWAVGLVGVGFSYLMLTDYALMHEATHGTLHGRRRVNDLLGVATGLLIWAPFSMVRITHQNHHLQNRTDRELFDQFRPQDKLFLKYAQWYSILGGLFWPLIPLGGLLFSLFPGVLRTSVFQNADPARGLHAFTKMESGVNRATRIETLVIGAFWAAFVWLLGLRLVPTLVLYACFSFNWSTRQYVAHAYTRRHVVEGALNLRHWWPMRWILLQGIWHLNHHRKPEVSWVHLHRLSPPDEPRPSYVRQYWRQWLGPRPCTEPEPAALAGPPPR